MNNSQSLRSTVSEELSSICERVNSCLSGDISAHIARVLKRYGRNQEPPHWFLNLKNHGHLPNLDGKTIGSVVEMLFAAVVETETLVENGIKLEINPARGVDLPDLDLGVKSPSTNYCTSEPFFSAYERLLGSEYDVVVLLTNYQTAKSTPPLKLQLLDGQYLTGSQLADRNLCRLARRIRTSDLASHDPSLKKIFRFLAYVNQSSWRAKQLLKLLDSYLMNPRSEICLEESQLSFSKQNLRLSQKGQDPLPKDELDELERILTAGNHERGLVDACDNWIIDEYQSFAQLPNSNEWKRLESSPLDGKIGMSFALQWRYNFSKVFDNQRG